MEWLKIEIGKNSDVDYKPVLLASTFSQHHGLIYDQRQLEGIHHQ